MPADRVEPPEIDVVILSLDRVAMTVAAVESVLRQRGARPRLWVIDQGSEPTSIAELEAALKPMRDVHLSLLGENLGVAGGRNVGIRLGSAEIVVCIDNDAEFWDTDALSYTAQQFKFNPRLGALGYCILDHDSGALDRRSWVYPRTQLPLWNQSFMATRFCGAGHALRREAFQRADGYDPRLFFYWEELDLSNRMIQLGYEIAYDPHVAVLHKRATEGRVGWETSRYYYLVRNALFLEWKFYRSRPRWALMAFGYLIKGLYNDVVWQAVRGVRDALKESRSLVDDSAKLGLRAKTYIREHELRFRGNLISRLRKEVLVRLR